MEEVKKYPQVPGTTDAELDAFLSQPSLVARLSTINPDGTPHTMPIWYEWRDGEIIVSTQVIQRKVKNMQRDPRVTVLIDTCDFPYRGVMIYGEASFDHDDAMTKRIGIFERYFGDREAAEDYARKLADKWEPVMVHIKPNKIISFDYTKGSLVPIEEDAGDDGE
ncbi:MAG: TIGR03618 family F420-dependent PPOX class oxidoreductase [Chloroflexota bacterium]